MATNNQTQIPDSTAVRVALWRALHVQLDASPHILDDEIGLKLAAPTEGWKGRPDMDPQRTRTFRTSIVTRARFIEDLLEDQLSRGVHQFVILGAGLDTFVQRKPNVASKLTVFEVDKPATQNWKRQRLLDLNFGIPKYLQLVPVDFEAGASWLTALKNASFKSDQPAVISSTGVSMYLTKEAIASTLREITTLATGSTFVMSFLRPVEMADPAERPGFEAAIRGARASGTPFLSFFKPEEIVSFARECGLKKADYVSADDLTKRYFSQRTDGLRPSNGEELLVVRV